MQNADDPSMSLIQAHLRLDSSSVIGARSCWIASSAALRFLCPSLRLPLSPIPSPLLAWLKPRGLTTCRNADLLSRKVYPVKAFVRSPNKSGIGRPAKVKSQTIDGT